MEMTAAGSMRRPSGGAKAPLSNPNSLGGLGGLYDEPATMQRELKEIEQRMKAERELYLIGLGACLVDSDYRTRFLSACPGSGQQEITELVRAIAKESGNEVAAWLSKYGVKFETGERPMDALLRRLSEIARARAIMHAADHIKMGFSGGQFDVCLEHAEKIRELLASEGD